MTAPEQQPEDDEVVVVRDLTRWGEGLAGAVERYWFNLFVGGLLLIAATALIAVILAPIRQPLSDSSTVAVIAVGLALTTATLVVLAQASDCYRALRRWRAIEVGVVLVAAALVSAIHPLRSQLWLPACAILGVLATLIPLRRALGYVLLVLIVNLGAHIAAGDLDDVPAVAVVGLWVGFPFWAILGHATNRMASEVIADYARRARPPQLTPRRVAGWVTPIPPRTLSPAPALPSEPRQPVRHNGKRLTPRQEQVVALMIAGLRDNEIAERLGLGQNTVTAHVENAIDRIDARDRIDLVWRVAIRWWAAGTGDVAA